MSQTETIQELARQIEVLKAQLGEMRPLSPSLLAALHRPLDIEITHTSNAIEGNTLTLRETKEVVEHGITVSGKPLKDHLEAQDHHFALEYMYELASQSHPVGERTVRELHTLVMKRSGPDIAGLYSPGARYISGSDTTFPHPLQTPELMREFGRELEQMEPTPANAFHAHYRLTRIHPFADGNGRTARLLMNLVLVRGGYRPIAVRPEDRASYIAALETASNQEDLEPFRALMHQRLRDTMKAYVALIGETLENEKALSERARGADPAHHEESASYAAFMARKRKPEN